MQGVGMEKDGFVPVKPRNMNRGQKTFKDQQEDETFNKFDALDDLVQEEGIPIDM